MLKHSKEFIIILFFVIISVFIFRNYFIKNTVPFSSNLLVFLYEPFKSYTPPLPNKPAGFDNLRIYYPLRSLATDQIKAGKVPLWNPYAFSGNTLLATYQSAIFHPLSALFLILPLIDAWSFIIIIQPILAALFTYLFLKEIGISRRGSIVGAIAFAFSGYSIVWWEESFMSVSSGLFLPLTLLGVNKIFKGNKSWGFLILLGSLTFSIIAGWFQITMYVFLFTFLWSIFLLIESRKKSIKNLLIVFSAFLLSFLTSGIHLIPSLEAYLLSPRGNTDARYLFDGYLLELTNWPRIIFPDFFGNPGTYNYYGKGFYYETTFFIAIPLFILAIYGITQFKKSGKIKFFSASFLICLSLAFSLPTSWFLLYSLNLPLISTVLPSRILFISVFSLSVLAAFGFDYFMKKPELKKLIIIVVLLGLLCFSTAEALFQDLNTYKDPSNFVQIQKWTTSLRNMVIPCFLFAVTSFVLFASVFFKRKKLPFPAFLLITGLALVNIFYFSSKYLYFSDRSSVFPKNPALTELKELSSYNRVWGYGQARIESNFATFYELQSPEGYDSFYIKRYGELLSAASQKGKYSGQIPRADANIVSDGYEKGIESNVYRKKLLTLMGVRYILQFNSDPKPPENKDVLKKSWGDGKFTIYEYKNAFPRAFLADEYKVIPDPQNLLNNLFNQKTDLRNVVLLEETPGMQIDKTKLKGEAKIISYSPNEIVIKTDSNKNSLLFLSDAYFPGWTSYVDNNQVKIYRANYAFRAIEIPSGIHEIKFIYQPKTFTYGIIFTITGILLSLLVFLMIKKKRFFV